MFQATAHLQTESSISLGPSGAGFALLSAALSFLSACFARQRERLKLSGNPLRAVP